MCKKAVELFGGNLAYVPHELKTYEMCLSAVTDHGYALKDVPDEYRKYAAICDAAINNLGYALQYVPDEMKTLAMCRLAYSKSRNVANWIPEKILSIMNRPQGSQDRGQRKPVASNTHGGRQTRGMFN